MTEEKDKKDTALVRAANRWGGFAAVLWHDPVDNGRVGRAATGAKVMPVHAKMMVDAFLARAGMARWEE